MHALGMIVFWVAVQVTVIAVLILAVLRFAGRSDPRWRSRVIFTGIVCVLFLSVCGISPWPSWSELWEVNQSAELKTSSPSVEHSPKPDRATDSEISETKAASAEPVNIETHSIEKESPWSAAWSAFRDQLKKPQNIRIEESRNPEPAKSVFTLGTAIGFVFLVGVGLGLVRLFAGMGILRREVAKSRVIENVPIRETIRKILGDSPKAQAIEVRVTGKLQTAATTGIFRPVILLPECWETWSEEDLHAVLAHEVNHIQRKDCLASLCAELVRVLHFYHPLMHWLAGRLRLEQELAADARASRFLGGQNRYLCILAEMALRQDSRAPAWPASAFLPSHRTLIRRIEMLRKNRIDQNRTSPFWRTATMLGLGLATVFAVGLRDRTGEATAQEPGAAPAKTVAFQDSETTAGEKADRQAFPLTYVPEDAIAAFGVRPAELLQEPSMKPLAQVLLKSEETAKPFGIPLEKVEQAVWSFGVRDSARNRPMLIAAMIRTSVDLDLESLKESITPESDTGFYGGQLYIKKRGSDGPAFWLADERTLVLSDSETGLKQAIDARNLSANREKPRIPAWESVADQSAASYGNIGLLRRIVGGGGGRFSGAPGAGRNPMPFSGEQGMEGRFGGEGGFSGDPGARTPQRKLNQFGLNPMIGPLWSDVETAVGGLNVGETIEAKITIHSKDAESSQKVKQTLDAMLVLGRNMVEQNRQMVGQLPPGEREFIKMLLEASQEVMKTLEVNQKDADVIVSANVQPKTVKEVTTALQPAIESAQNAARLAQARNDLKQIGLALHNYHATHDHFPKPVMTGPDGKTTHSWRVAILPFIDQGPMYEQYRLNEPWDSEHNKKLLAKIPNVFRHPRDKKDSTHAGYFALTGKNTLLGNSKRNIALRDVIDGSSNTLMVVEAKREVPWIKPMDIPYEDDRTKDLPKLGGWFEDGFLALFGDGSVQFIASSVEKSKMQNLIERNDSNVVNLRGGRGGRPGRGPGNEGAPSSSPPGSGSAAKPSGGEGASEGRGFGEEDGASRPN